MASNIQPTGLDWKNLPDKTTPISAENLNKMANTIDDLVEAVNPLNTVEANPEGTPTEGLEKVEIDGTLYEVKGGHKILNDSGTTLTQKDNLQFKGVYTQNNGDNTEVNICRTMTKTQMEALSGEELKGFINTSDEPDGLPLTAEWVAYDSNTSVKEKIDEVDSKFIKFTLLSQPSNIPTSPTSYNCNWQDYDVLSFELCRYSNVRANIIVSKAYFSTTSDSGRVMIASNTGMEVSIWQNGQGSITANANSQASDWNVKVWGISLATN